jgi:hypothetical protein
MENEKKRSGWRTAGLIAGVGCLSIIVIIVGGVVIASMYARATLANLGDPDPKPVERRIALPSPVTNTTKKPGGPADRSALRLTLDLREGDFTIQPGAPGNDVQVRGEFAPGLYELVETQDTDAETGVRRATVRFRSKAPAWARMFAGIGGGDNVRPHLTVTIPRGAPIDLNLQLALGRSEVDLGGLTLGEVSVNTTMGEHSIDFHEPVVEGLRELRINTSMGNLALENLGNAHADTIHASGSMGNVTANLGGSWPAGATSSVTFEQSMGELTLRVPNTVRLDADVRSSQGGETTNRTTQDATTPSAPNAPTLRLRVNSSMGNARVVRY